MAKKKPRFYVVASEGNVWIFTTIAQAQVECYYILKELTGDPEYAKSYSNSIDNNFQTPPYPDNRFFQIIDRNVLEQIINDIALDNGINIC